MKSLTPITIAMSLAHPLVSAHPVFTGVAYTQADDLLPSYDYVIVGAGASGLTVANRLSERSGK